MATFTRNAWVTGEIITATGLNGGKGFPLLALDVEDYPDSSASFEIEIEPGLTALDFINTMVSVPSSIDDSGDEPVATETIYYKSSQVEISGDYIVISCGEVSLYYTPETGILTSEGPDDDSGVG